MVRLTDYPNGEERGGDFEVRDEQSRNELPHYMTGAIRGRPSHFYINGNSHFCAKKVVLNTRYVRDFNHYLDYLTDTIKPPFGAVRQVCTPQNGHRISTLTELQPGASYVVVGGGKFRRCPYDQITSTERRKSPPRNYDADPVVHSKIFRCSGKVKKYNPHSKIIRVSANGKGQQGAKVVLLHWRIPWTLPEIIKQVDDMLRVDCEGSVERIYTTNGYQVLDIDQIQHMGHYVAMKKSDHFKKGPYFERPLQSIKVSPRPSDGRLYLEPIRSNNSTSHSSPDNSNASTQNGSLNGYSRHKSRRRDRDRNENNVFPAKPVKHTRSSEKRQPIDLDKDDGGKFKAKQRNYNTAGAREVQENRQTKVDVPLDQQDARPVEDERIKRKDKVRSPEDESDDNNRPRHEPQPQQQPQQRNNDHQRGGVPYKANSKRPPQAAPPANPSKDTNNTDHLKYKDEERRRNEAATKIQAGYKGHKVRKQNLLEHKDETPQRYSPPKTPPGAQSPIAREPSRQGWTPEPIQTPTPRETSRNSRSPEHRHSTPARERGQTPQSLEKNETFDEMDKAAIKIQSCYRGHATRKRLRAEKELKETQNKLDEEASDLNKAEDDAAIKIQANYRGFKARKDLKSQQAEKEDNRAQSPENPGQPDKGPNLDDDLDDLDDDFEKANAAATKIQSTYRGHLVRRDMKANRGIAY